jgi:uncharacterized protein with FMN-binding domain
MLPDTAACRAKQDFREEAYSQMKPRSTPNKFTRVIRKGLLSAFLVASFGAYALEHNHQSGAVAQATAEPGLPAGLTAASTPTSTAPAAPPPVAAAPTAEPPTPTPEPAPTTGPVLARGSGLKDGTYTGPAVDVNWGIVTIRATIQGGKISDVQFVEYPSDRRTSVRINTQVMPWLKQEAIQAQSANVDIISGATLTSEGFAQSLQGALDQARS